MKPILQDIAALIGLLITMLAPFILAYAILGG
jgi:hypothetical protein